MFRLIPSLQARRCFPPVAVVFKTDLFILVVSRLNDEESGLEVSASNRQEFYRTDPVNEKAVLAVLLTSERSGSHQDDPLEELAGLAEAAGTDVVASVIQRRSSPDPATCLGHGKVEELKALVEMHEADVVIFDNDLQPGQTRNLEKYLEVKVLDRTELILDIFALRAQTHEARLAVELAQLEYSMPRLKRMWTHLSRQTKGGVGLRGPGEKQLEVDKRLAQKRISDLKRELEAIHQRKKREVGARKDISTVSLVGYTNAGKSALLNQLTDSDVFVKDLLFATLDTRTRRWQIPGWGCILLSDTVGFIRNLPHHLVAGFRATLEEAVQADLLLHVADGSNPLVFEQIQAAREVLAGLGIDEKRTLLVINKADAFAPWDDQGREQPGKALQEGIEKGDLSNLGRYRRLQQMYPQAIFVSAEKKWGFNRLEEAVVEALSRNSKTVKLTFPLENGKLLALLSKESEVLSKEFSEQGEAIVTCRIANRYLNVLPPGVDVQVLAR